MTKQLLISLLFLSVSFTGFSQNPVCANKLKTAFFASPGASYSDTIDIVSFKISLDLTQYAAKTLYGTTDVKLVAKTGGLNIIKLDLLKLTVDSIKDGNGSTCTYTYNDTTLSITPNSTLSAGDTLVLSVSYRGNPQKDASGWGGWYWDAGYSYNLGVGFDANPHSYGRVWHPCLDNFVERASYEYFVKTPLTQKAFCNGILLGETTAATSKTWHWKQNETIPAYLASVTMAAYATIQQTFNGMNGAVPIQIAAVPTDTTNVKTSMAKLIPTLTAFETRYGPYMWPRVGYCMVPFASGAMEHSCNITYPRSAANGSLANETLYAHELSHHWWGDLVTCDKPEDMWINEGNASYCEHLFTEAMYGKNAYKTSIAANHRSMLQFLHINEGYMAVSGVPHQHTYSDHVYKKGADMVHTLRGYLGDSLYFKGSTAFLTANQYKDVNTQKYSDFLSNYTGIDCSHFFNDWILTPGYAGFSVDTFRSVPLTSLYDVTYTIKQRLKGRTSYATNVPLQITFVDAAQNKYYDTVLFSGVSQTFTAQLPTNIKMIIIDEGEYISDAVTEGQKTVKTTGNHDFGNGIFSLNVSAINDSALVRVEHHWTAPDSVNMSNVTLSKSRFWKLHGVFPANFSATALLTYNGRSTQSGTGCLDTWINIVEDSLKVFYRADASDSWTVLTNVTQNKSGSATDKFGTFTVTNVQPGEYCIGIRNTPLGIKKATTTAEYKMRISPNPAKGNVLIQFENIRKENMYIEVVNVEGKVTDKLSTNGNDIHLSTEKYSAGIYFVQLVNNERILQSEKLVVSDK